MRSSKIAIWSLVLTAVPVLAMTGSWERFTSSHDQNGDGAVTLEELLATRPGVVRFDADGDREVTQDEVRAWFVARDTDGDGRLTAAENPPESMRCPMQAGPDEGSSAARRDAGTGACRHGHGARRARGDGEHVCRGQRADRHGGGPAAADRDGDGVVTREEWDAATAERPGAKAARRDACWERRDSDRDGVLSGDELATTGGRCVRGRAAS